MAARNLGVSPRTAAFVPVDKGDATNRNLIALAIMAILVASLTVVRHEASKDTSFVYILPTVANNYFQFGAVHRGLAASSIHLMGVSLVNGAIFISILSLLIFVALSYCVLIQIPATGLTLLPFLIILGTLALFWSADIGRTDMFAAAIILLAALAVVKRRLIAASFCLAVGVEVHEVVLIFGLPVIAMLLVDAGRYRCLEKVDAVIAVAILTAGLIVYVIIPYLPHSSSATIIQTVSAEVPLRYQGPHNDFSLYILASGDAGMGTGKKSIVASLCGKSNGFRYYVEAFVAIGMIGIAILALSDVRKLRWMAPAAAGIPSMLFLWVTGADMGRWVVLGIFSSWLVCAFLHPPDFLRGRWPIWGRVACALMLVPLVRPIPELAWAITTPSPLVERTLNRFVGPRSYRTIDECDPNWRSSGSRPVK